MALDRSENRLAQQYPRGPHRCEGSDVVQVSSLACGDGLEIVACAERTAGAGKHCDTQPVVLLVGLESGCQRLGRHPVDGISYLGPIDRDDDDASVTFR